MRTRDIEVATRIVETLVAHPPLLRSELATILGVSQATISRSLPRLLERGLLAHTAWSYNGLGRPASRVSVAPRAAFAVGLDLGAHTTRIIVCDAFGSVVARRSHSHEVVTRTKLVDRAFHLTMSALSTASVDAASVVGIGVGIGADLSPRRPGSRAKAAVPARWEHMDATRKLGRRFGWPITVASAGTMGAIGEQRFGAARGIVDIAYVALDSEAEVGILLDGEPYLGAPGSAGAFSHQSVSTAGPKCRCGLIGCLAPVANPEMIALRIGRDRHEAVDVNRMLELVRGGDPAAVATVSEAGFLIGNAVSWLVSFLNPRMVIIGGELSLAGPALIEPIRERVCALASPTTAACVEIKRSVHGRHAEALGAAASQLVRVPEFLTRQLTSASRTLDAADGPSATSTPS